MDVFKNVILKSLKLLLLAC